MATEYRLAYTGKEMDERLERANITGSGQPSATTVGVVGNLYMDTDTGELYKCVAIENGVYSWQAVIETLDYLYNVNLNKTELEFGSFNYNNGAAIASDIILRTNDFISVEPNTDYQIYSERNNASDTSLVFEYDKNKTFIRYATCTNGFVTSASGRYIKIRTQTNGQSGYELCPINTRIMVEKNTSRTYAFDSVKTSANKEFDIFLKSLKYPNINKSEFEYGSFTFNTGYPADSETILRSDRFIPVEENTLYQIYSERLELKDTQYVFEYDKNKAFIRWQTMTAALFEKGVTTHENCRYIKIRTLGNGESGGYELCPIDTRIMVEKGNVKTYFDKIVAENLVFPDNDLTITSRLKVELENFTNAMVQKEFDLGFLAITDTHSKQDDLFKIMAYFAKNHIGDFVIHLGDIAVDTSTKEEKILKHKHFIETARSGSGADVYVLRGNHENNHPPSHPLDIDYHLTDKDFYNQSTRNTNGVVKEYPYNYFYRDFDEYKIRVIFLDAGDIYNEDGEMCTTGLNVMYQQRQIDWLKNKALNFEDKTDKSEWSVLTLEHSLPYQVGCILNAFMNGTSYTGTYTFNYAEEPFEVDLSCDFTSQGAIEYIGHVSGHLHADNISNIADVVPTRPAMEIRNATINDVELPSMDDFAMDFITIDKANRKINAYRFGAGTDREVSY